MQGIFLLIHQICMLKNIQISLTKYMLKGEWYFETKSSNQLFVDFTFYNQWVACWNIRCWRKKLYCIPRYRDYSTAKIAFGGSFRIFFVLKCRKWIGMGSCHAMWCLLVFMRFGIVSKEIFIILNTNSKVLEDRFSLKKNCLVPKSHFRTCRLLKTRQKLCFPFLWCSSW